MSLVPSAEGIVPIEDDSPVRDPFEYAMLQLVPYLAPEAVRPDFLHALPPLLHVDAETSSDESSLPSLPRHRPKSHLTCHCTGHVDKNPYRGTFIQ